jgi:hypothetical protein
MRKINLGDLPCFVCRQPVIGLQGQDYDWDTYLLDSDQEQNQHALDENAFGPCHLICLTRSEWGHFWIQRYLERRGEGLDDLSFDGWQVLPGGDWTTTIVHESGWLATVSHRSVRLAEPHADGMRMPIFEGRFERLHNYPEVFETVRAAFAQEQVFSMNAFIDALHLRPYVYTPQALDRATLHPKTATVNNGRRSGLTLAVILSYDVWLPTNVFEKLRRSVPDAPVDMDRLWQALETMELTQVVSLLGRGVSPDLANEAGNTPLMFAAGWGDIDLARVLFSYGATTNLRNFETGMTALHTAAVQDKADLAALLLEHGADPEMMDELGDTPLNNAEYSGAAEVIALFQRVSAGQQM